jgi:hypothetical protein
MRFQTLMWLTRPRGVSICHFWLKPSSSLERALTQNDPILHHILVCISMLHGIRLLFGPIREDENRCRSAEKLRQEMRTKEPSATRFECHVMPTIGVSRSAIGNDSFHELGVWFWWGERSDHPYSACTCLLFLGSGQASYLAALIRVMHVTRTATDVGTILYGRTDVLFVRFCLPFASARFMAL